MATTYPTSDDRDRRALRELARSARGGVLALERASEVLGVPTRTASAALSGLARRGWLKRLRRGLYLVLPLEADVRTSGVVDDPWLLAMELFSPCYVAGWSAAEHWGLTEQIFRSTFVATSSRVRRVEFDVAGMEFHLAHVTRARVASVGTIWRGAEKVPVSSPERTLTDALMDPAWVGGVRHLAEMMRTHHESKAWHPDKLLSELEAIGTGAAFKRLGFLAEALALDSRLLVKAAEARRSAGVAKLDPAIRTRGRLLKRWGLWVNADVEEGSA